MNKKYLYLTGAVLVLALIGSLIIVNNSSDTSLDNNSAKQSKNTNLLPTDFTLKDYDGNDVSLADYIGKPLVINSWAAWCPFCVEELEEFAAVQKELGDAVVIIAIDRAESLSRAKSFTDELGVTDDLVFLLDSRDAFYKKIGGFSMPETVFVDKDGNIIIHKRGPMQASEIKDKINSIL